MNIDTPPLSIQLSASNPQLDKIKTGMNSDITRMLTYVESLFFKNIYYNRFLLNIVVEKFNNELLIEITKSKKCISDYRNLDCGFEDCIKLYFIRKDKEEQEEKNIFRLSEIIFITYRTDFKVEIDQKLSNNKKITFSLSFLKQDKFLDYPIFDDFFDISSSDNFCYTTSKFEFYCVNVQFDCKTQKNIYDVYFSYGDREYSLISEINKNHLNYLIKECNHYPKTVEDICDGKAINLLEMLIV